MALDRRDGRKHFCHIDDLEALFRIRVTWFSRNFFAPPCAAWWTPADRESLLPNLIENSRETILIFAKITFLNEIRSA